MTGNNNTVLWESFQNPTDTFLPQMRILMDLHSGEDRIFSSWTSKNDPSPGRYSFGFDPRGSPQIVVWDGPSRRWRSGYWDGLLFTGVPDMKASYLYGFRLSFEEDRLYFTYTPADVSDLVRYQIIRTGYELQQKWDEYDGQWKPIQYLTSGGCDPYNLCGNFARCDVSNTTKCLCLEGFVPNDLGEWKAGNWTGGCVRETELECKTNRDVFMAIERIKLPDFADTADAESIDECKSKCLENCSCTAYAFFIGINCMIWSGELVDLQQFKERGKILYVRVAHSESGKDRTNKIVLISALVAGAFVVSIAVWIIASTKPEDNRPRGKMRCP
ncbi:hypothetical protein HAX54_030535 [Datura stramonium]|uniref:Apple domain-containing protein n=1 Tax=Datura stramonium TaxID=4076 RepID=A0ABS8VA37_DATST|nr:hypothetical protein [Datura stramonium]